MARAWACSVEKLKLGITVPSLSARGSLKCATCHAKVVRWPERRLKSYCSGGFSPTSVRSGPMVPPKPLMTWQARQPFSLTSFLARLIAVAPGVSRS